MKKLTAPADILTEKFEELHEKVRQYELQRRTPSHQEVHSLLCHKTKGLGAMRVSINDILASIINSKVSIEGDFPTTSWLNQPENSTAPIAEKPMPPHIKITLRITEEILLYEQRSTTALRDTEESRLVEQENKRYEELTTRKDRDRHIRHAETQTLFTLMRSREANTEGITCSSTAAYVSNFEMFDTYRDIEKSTESVNVHGKEPITVTTYKPHGVDQFAQLNCLPSFNLALMITMRILAGNVFEPQQRRFRNMELPDPLAPTVRFRYHLELLWRYAAPNLGDTKLHSVADMSWCPRNGDILAVAYGTGGFVENSAHLPRGSCVCVWNIKNPVSAERNYEYSVPVSCVEFSPFVSQLLAIGFYDGSVQVRDISNPISPPVSRSQRSSCSSYEPIVAIKWILQKEIGGSSSDHTPFLALSRNGVVTKYRIITGPHLLAYQLMRLERVDGILEGLLVSQTNRTIQANRQPQGLDLVLSPLREDVYYVLTDEGCLHKCSTLYPHQNLEVWQLHEAAVNGMEYSPWSPKLFLTYGNDWCVRIWLEDVLQPLITLKHAARPINSAHWSRTHSTVLVTLSGKSIDVWDIRRSTLKPASSRPFNQTLYTLCKLSNCSRSLAAGTAAGDILMLTFEDMPFAPYFQYEALEAALLAAIDTDVELTRIVKSLGYFGYGEPKKHKHRRSKIKSKNKTKEKCDIET